MVSDRNRSVRLESKRNEPKERPLPTTNLDASATCFPFSSPHDTDTLFTLRQSAKPKPMNAIEKVIQDGPDRELCRINALAFAVKHRLDEDEVIAAFLHGARLGIFDMSWNILCPACGGVLDSGATLKTVKQAEYRCVLCAED